MRISLNFLSFFATDVYWALARNEEDIYLQD